MDLREIGVRHRCSIRSTIATVNVGVVVVAIAVAVAVAVAGSIQRRNSRDRRVFGLTSVEAESTFPGIHNARFQSVEHCVCVYVRVYRAPYRTVPYRTVPYRG